MTDMSLIAADSLPAEPLDALREVSRSEVELDDLRWDQIAAARDAGASWAALVVAFFSHAYIWVHYLCTERPDMRLIYRS